MPEISWFSVKAPKHPEPFTECLELGQWTWDISSPIGHKYFGLSFTSGLIPSTVYIEKTFTGSDQNIVIYNLYTKTTTGRRKKVTLRRNYRKVDLNNSLNYLR